METSDALRSTGGQLVEGRAMTRGGVVVAGVGSTSFGKHPGRSKTDLIAEAVRKALEDGRLPKDRIDGLFVKQATSSPSMMWGQEVAQALGLRPAIGCSLDQGGAANIGLMTYAAMAIEAGMIEAAIVCYGDNPRSGSRASYHRPRSDAAMYGFFSTLASYGLVHQAYRHEFGAPDEAFGTIAVACRSHGAKNPHAQLRKPITMDDYRASPFAVEPLRRDDCCLLSDGAVAIVLTSAATARGLGIDKAVPILGFGQGQESWDVQRRPSLTSTVAGKSAAMAFKMAGIAPGDVGVAQLYDCFTVTVLTTLEDYGFCKPGQAGAYCRDVGIEVGGGLPINTSGGLLSETGTPGLQLIAEGVRQMRGDANLQVADPRYCVVSNQGGTMHTHATLILGQPS
jgi:acetyl-CoA acetyltransferase